MNKLKETFQLNKGITIFFIIGVVILLSLLIYYNHKNNFYKREDLEDITIEKKYEDNEYKPINITDENMAMIYYNYLKNLMINNPSTFWDTLDENVKSNFNKKEKFIKYIKNKVTVKTIGNTVQDFYIKKGARNEIYIKDSEDNKFIIEEKAVWDIKIINIS